MFRRANTWILARKFHLKSDKSMHSSENGSAKFVALNLVVFCCVTMKILFTTALFLAKVGCDN